MRINILLTCAASQVSPTMIGLMRTYDMDKIRVIGADSKPKELSVGAYFCDAFYQVPNGNEPTYKDAIINVIKKEQIHLIFPGSDEEVFVLSQIRDELNEQFNCRVASSNHDTTLLASNKYEMLSVLSKNNVRVSSFSNINTINDITDFAKQIGYPVNSFIIKPKVGRGSKGVKLVKGNLDERETFFRNSNFEVTLESVLKYFEKYPEEMANFFVMEYLSGEKYSADLLIEKGKIKACVTRSNGNAPKTNPPTQLADIVNPEDVRAYAEQVVKIADFDFFLQVEAGRNDKGELCYIETNPRLDATLPITLGVDLNFYHAMIDYAINGKMPAIKDDALKADTRIRFFRYWEHIFIK